MPPVAVAVQAAETEEAAARLTEYQQAELAEAEAAAQGFASKAVLNVLRLSQDELGFRWEEGVKGLGCRLQVAGRASGFRVGLQVGGRELPALVCFAAPMGRRA